MKFALLGIVWVCAASLASAVAAGDGGATYQRDVAERIGKLLSGREFDESNESVRIRLIRENREAIGSGVISPTNQNPDIELCYSILHSLRRIHPEAILPALRFERDEDLRQGWGQTKCPHMSPWRWDNCPSEALLHGQPWCVVNAQFPLHLYNLPGHSAALCFSEAYGVPGLNKRAGSLPGRCEVFSTETCKSSWLQSFGNISGPTTYVAESPQSLWAWVMFEEAPYLVDIEYDPVPAREGYTVWITGAQGPGSRPSCLFFDRRERTAVQPSAPLDIPAAASRRQGRD
jgi:hypothetical protein